MNQNNAIGIVKVSYHNDGCYLRIPSAAVRASGIRKGDRVAVYVSGDKRTIKFVKVPGEGDTIEIPDPTPRQEQAQIQVPKAPAPEPVEQLNTQLHERLRSLAQRFGLKK